jgi:molybdopterin-containing oxidoreductase family iron-sulfur binding subunit
LGSAALLTACGRPDEEIIPYADMPEGMVAGEPRRFATTLPLAGYGRGFLGITVDGRPIKIEGNARHPFSQGATDIFAEAEVLSLYDPDRSRVVQHKDAIATWDDFAQAWGGLAPDARVGLVTGRILSPTRLARIAALTQRYPRLTWFRYEPVNDDAARSGSRLAFGKVLNALPRWEDADCIVSLGADPLGMGPAQPRGGREFSRRRAGPSRQTLHVAEPAWTLTGAAADFRIALAPDSIGEIGRAIANQFGASLGAPALNDAARAFARHAANGLRAAKGRALVLAGDAMPPEIHALCHWLNGVLAAPITYTESLDPVEQDHGDALAALAEALHGRQLDALILLDVNPVYDAPDVFDIAKAIAAVPLAVHVGQYRDETGKAAAWHLPLSHVLESWGDARAPDGTASLIQPLIRPLYDSRTADEFLTLVAGAPAQKAHDLVQAQWRPKGSGDFNAWWRGALEQGVIDGSAAAAVTAPSTKLPQLPNNNRRGLSLILSPHPSLWDGRFANNAWLQECPAPFTKEVWGNAVQIAPEDAARIGVRDGDAVELAVEGGAVPATLAVMPGQAPGVLWGHWGAGRSQAGPIGNYIGVRYSGLGRHPFQRRIDAVRIKKSDAGLPLRSTQNYTQLAGSAEKLFPIAVAGDVAPEKTEPPPSLLATPPRGDYAWAMVVDTDACIGCNACVVACQAENNVPVVGPEEISQGRDMHWLRVDSYAPPESAAARRGFQPVPCMHCELAPCEPVCPVEASVHDHEGLNVQVYNRCIGTRFCEANCPYKVRRFNWFAYAGEQAYGGQAPALKAQHNPDVSARGRGVMEKCNYCLQRISRARRTAEKENRVVAEGEMVTACQAACPTRAIHFGDLNRADSGCRGCGATRAIMCCWRN